MKTYPFIHRLLAGLLLAAPLVWAEEDRHPSGFEPAPVFEDEGLTRKPGRPAAPSPGHAAPEPAKAPQPAAVVKPAPAPPPSPKAEIPTAPVSVAQPVVQAAPAAPQVSAPEQPAPKPTGLSALLTDNYPVGLIILALGGFILWSTRSSGRASVPSRRPPPEQPQDATGPTGVARYLSRLEADQAEKALTGVAKYLAKLN